METSQQLNALGMTSGIGSMLLGARQAGFNVLGNIEWRKYYHKKDEQGRNTFLENFPGAYFVYAVRDLDSQQRQEAQGVDLLMGHPECGKYSQLNSNNKNFRSNLHDPGDIPLFVDAVAELKPRFVVMDDLPKSMIAFPAEEYHKRLPDYDLFFEWVSNYHYGNVQLNRRRMFLVAALKTEQFVFYPGEEEHDLSVKDVIGDLVDYRDQPNHNPHVLNEPAAKGLHLRWRGDRATWNDVRAEVENKPEGWVLKYHAAGGELKNRPGCSKSYWERENGKKGHSYVLDGGSPCIHAIKGLPLSIRERARIQGFPDDFIFYGTRLNEAGAWNHDKNMDMVKQTGKAMPIQFNRFVASQIQAHIVNKDFVCSGERLIKPNSYIDEAKIWYCREVGYANQEQACHACWRWSVCGIRSHVYGIGTTEAVETVEPAQPAEQIKQPKPVKPKKKARLTSIKPKRVYNGRFTGERGNF